MEPLKTILEIYVSRHRDHLRSLVDTMIEDRRSSIERGPPLPNEYPDDPIAHQEAVLAWSKFPEELKYLEEFVENGYRFTP